MALRIPAFLMCALIVCVTAFADEAVETEKKKITKDAPVKKPVVVTVQDAKKVAEAQREAVKKLAAAQKAVADATKELAEAEQKAADAADEAAKKLAAEQVSQAKQKLEAAKKEATKQRAAVTKAFANRRQVVTAYQNAYVAAVREEVDPQDPIERFALLTPGGPVVVQVAITVDGKPFRVAREKLIDELLVAADSDKDGKATWAEALKSPKFTMGRIRVNNDQQRQQILAGLDKNGNEIVERAEVRFFIARYFGSPSFALTAGYGNWGSAGGVVLINGQAAYRGGGQVDVQNLLDTDNDGVLTAKEIAAAGKQLKSRDANDNDLLELNELTGGVGAANTRARAYTAQSRTQLAVLLGPTAKAETLFQVIQQRYKNKDNDVVAASFSTTPELFKSLDKNSDGKLQAAETLGLNDVKPDIELAVGLGKPDGPKGVSVKAIAPQLKTTKESDESITVELPGLKMSFLANLNQPQTYDYSKTADSYLTRYDKDNNGYLEKKELPTNFASQFELWDADVDGKVYAKEIIASYTRMMAPQMSQVRASTSNQGNSLFQALDVSGDGRLSLREMRSAHERIKTFDENKDDRITQNEIPVTVSTTFGLGNAGYAYTRTAQGARNATNRPKTNDAPEWFTRMDRNGDGDVTLKEFLGSKEAFEKLDTNSDGFIEPKEAKAAEKSK